MSCLNGKRVASRGGALRDEQESFPWLDSSWDVCETSVSLCVVVCVGK